jgi:hypothetical protein
MVSLLRRAWPRLAGGIAGLVVLWTLVLVLHGAILRHTGGEPSYPVDDAFIHLAIAKSLAFSGTFGVVPHTFASASSSIVWPWLLAGLFRVCGDSPWAPWWLNLALASLVPFAIDALVVILAGERATLMRRSGIGVLVVLLGPLPTLVTIGMEHTLHALVVLVFVRLLALGYERRAMTLSECARLCVVSALLTGARYEGLLLVLLGSGLVAFRRSLRAGAATLGAGLLPIVAFGIYSRSHGHYFLPLSVLLKRRPIDWNNFTQVPGDFLQRLASERHLLVLVLAALALAAYVFYRARGAVVAAAVALRRSLVFLLLAVLMLVFHVQFGGLGWFYRYDSYLVVLLLTLVLGVAAAQVPLLSRANLAHPGRWALGLAALAMFAPVFRRAWEATAGTPFAARNVYEQQVQSARFLAAWFPTGEVAVNDIGAVAYYRSEPLVDMVGLADKAVADAKGLRMDRPMSPEVFLERTKGVKVAIIYDAWFVGQLPADWVKVVTWGIEGNRSCAFPKVSVYATRADAVAEVTHAVVSFRDSLPKGVTQEGPAAGPPRQPLVMVDRPR